MVAGIQSGEAGEVMPHSCAAFVVFAMASDTAQYCLAERGTFGEGKALEMRTRSFYI